MGVNGNIGIIIAIPALFVFGVHAAEPDASRQLTMDAKFEALAGEFLESLLRSSPVGATRRGDHRFDHLLDEVDADARKFRLASAREFISGLERIELGKLSRHNQVDYHLLRHHLREEVWQIEELREWQWNPLVYSSVAGNSIYGLMARESDDPGARLMAAGARLRELPRFLEQVRKALSPERVPAVHAKTCVDQNRGLTKLLDNMLKPRLGDLAGDERRRVEDSIEVARRAVARHQKWLESELLPNAKGDPRLGAERYAEKFGYELFTTVPPAQFRKRAERQLADLHTQMYVLAKRIQLGRAPGTKFPKKPSAEEKRALIRSCLEIAYADRPERDGVVASANQSLEITTKFVRERDLISVPADPLEIILMPEFRRGVSLAYCDAPGPLEVGQKTFYAVAPPPADWTPTQVESLLREYNRRSLHTLTIHEAMPGHFLQFAHANRFKSRLRSVLSSGTFIEGWAVYCEWMMCEEGFLEDDPLMSLITLKWYLRDVTNALLDQMVHIDGIEEDEATNFLMDQAFQEESEASKKFTRALLTSGQLATYFSGYLEHVDLRRSAEERLGDQFDLKSYHDKVLSYGSPPTRFVRALLLDEDIPD